MCHVIKEETRNQAPTGRGKKAGCVSYQMICALLPLVGTGNTLYSYLQYVERVYMYLGIYVCVYVCGVDL